MIGATSTRAFIKHVLIIISITVSGLLPAYAEEMKLAKFWQYELKMAQACAAEKPGDIAQCQHYFACDYTSRSCQDGYRFRFLSGAPNLFTILGEDRRTVRGHFVCSFVEFTSCLNFDTGEWISRHPYATAESDRGHFQHDKPDGCEIQDRCQAWLNANMPTADSFGALMMRNTISSALDLFRTYSGYEPKPRY
jgi:hypothetical protein